MATIDIILRERIDGLGAEADLVSVRRGYARNFLIPTGKAMEATKSNMTKLENLKRARAEREARELEEAQGLAAKINKLRLKLTLALGHGGKAFGSITTQDISQAISAKLKNVTIDRHHIGLEKPIKGTGKYEVAIKIHHETSANLRLEVIPEEKAQEAKV